MPRLSSSISRMHLNSFLVRSFADVEENFKLSGRLFVVLLTLTYPARRFCNSCFSVPSVSSISCTEPDVHAFVSAINSCSSVSTCEKIHVRVIKSLNYNDCFIGDRLVSLYSKLGLLEYAQKLFDEIPKKDLVSWNSLISGFSRKAELVKCFNAFQTMRLEAGLEPNEVTLISIVSTCANMSALYEGISIHGLAVKTGLINETKFVNSLIMMYGKLGHVDLAMQLFGAMVEPSLISWNTIILVCVENEWSDEALSMFNMMQRQGAKPDQATMVTLLQGCGDIGVIKMAEAVHGYILNAGLNENIAIATSMVSVYAKSGRLDISGVLFREMKDPDRIAWTAMVGGYAMHGHGKEAIVHFDLMVQRGVKPDHVTFTHLLSACSHSGLIKEGKRYFDIMSRIYGIEPRLDHYACMVDLFGRSSCLEDAYDLIKKMPMEPNHGVWGALLNACRICKNVELGKEVAERLFALNPFDQRNYIMLSNIYAATGHWKKASKVKALMRERGVSRTPGCSLIEHRNKIHQFVAGDRTHPDTNRIYLKLEELIKKIQKIGYEPKTEFVLHDVDEDIKEDMIKEHSEKLAIAFGLLVSQEGMPVVVNKNIRICGDCHSMAKFVSLTEKRLIIIRDVRRFHHFADGLCSCGDYW